MEVTLSRSLEVRCFEVFAEIAKSERRQEIQAVLLLGQEHGGRLTPDLICRELLGGRPPVVGRTIIQRCRLLQLLEGSDDEAHLTDKGRESASTGVVFIPERGKYRIWVTDDPLFTEAALDILAVKESSLSTEHVRESRQAYGRLRGQPRGRTNGGAVDMKEASEQLRGRLFTPLKPDSQACMINFVGPEWVSIEDSITRARITWTMGEHEPGRVRVDGAFQAERLIPPDISFEKVWLGLLGPRAKDWYAAEDEAHLRCGFDGDGLTDTDRRTFRRTLAVENPSVPGLGAFDALEVSDIPIAPRGPQDAQAWAEWLLEDRVLTYQDEESYNTMQEGVRRLFPGFKLTLPSRVLMVNRIRQRVSPREDGRQPPAFWFLQAPLDLAEGTNSENTVANETSRRGTVALGRSRRF